MTKFGQVTAYDAKTNTATIQYARPDACEKCGGCGTLSAMGSIALTGECKVGDWVRMEFPDSRFVHAAALAYGIPLLGFLGGLLLGHWLSGSEGGAILGSLLGLGLSLLTLWLNERRIRGRAEWTARIQEVYPEKPTLESIGCGGEAF